LFASIGAYESPMPWLPDDGRADSVPAPPTTDNPDEMVESFFRRLASDSAGEGLNDAARADRLADGPALMAELGSLRSTEPFDVTQLSMPVLFGVGGVGRQPHHRPPHERLLEHVPGSEGMVVDAAGHGIHLTHPDAFALFVRRAVERRSPD